VGRPRRSGRERWLRWLGVWFGLMLGLRLLLGMLLPPIMPEPFLWFGAFALGSSLTFFLMPSPVDE
jgi:hypothetical protein